MVGSASAGAHAMTLKLNQRTCEQLRKQFLLYYTGTAPNRILVDDVRPAVLLLDQATRDLEKASQSFLPTSSTMAEMAATGIITMAFPYAEMLRRATMSYGFDGLLDDIKRLRKRVDLYVDTVNQVAQADEATQRRILSEYVVIPMFGGARHEPVGSDDPSTWIETLSDFCEPARLYGNLGYVWNENSWQKTISRMSSAVQDSAQELLDNVIDAMQRVIKAASTAASETSTLIVVGAAALITIVAAGAIRSSRSQNQTALPRGH